jgi:AcrR family transcriptional regulator
MPPRDSDEYEQRRNQILDGALDVFARKGFENATNKEIAEAAGINSPGLIYHYFADKADLFLRAVERHVPIIGLLDHPEELMDLPPREALIAFARTLLIPLSQPRLFAAYRMLLGEALRRPAIAEMLSKVVPQRGLELMSRYLEQAMARGELRRMDTRIAVRAFIGPLIALVITREIFRMPDVQDVDVDTYIAEIVDLFLRGMQP